MTLEEAKKLKFGDRVLIVRSWRRHPMHGRTAKMEGLYEGKFFLVRHLHIGWVVGPEEIMGKVRKRSRKGDKQ